MNKEQFTKDARGNTIQYKFDSLVDVYNDTLEYLQNFDSKASSTKHKVLSHNSSIRSNRSKLNNVSVEPLDTISAVVKYQTGKVLVLNMANAWRPGGGVENGARAQEECLFRASDLPIVCDKSFYPIENAYLYNKDVTFFKDKDYQYMDPVVCDVITIPAYDKRKVFINDSIAYKIMYNRIHAIFEAGEKNGVSTYILGAFGCGVFRNKPEVVSLVFKNVIEDMKITKKIVFAIINDMNATRNNYTIFKERFA